MNLAVLLILSQLAQAAASLILAWRLLRFHLRKNMPGMIILQFWTATVSVLAVWFFSSPHHYNYFYGIVTPINCLVNILVVRELFALVFDRYPGIRMMGRWIMYVSVGVSVGASLLIAWLFWTQAFQHGVLVWVLLERSVSLCLALLILCILFCLSRYPLRLPVNFSVSSSLYSVTFLTESLVLLLGTISPKVHSPAMDIAQTAVVSGCLLFWFFMLEPANSPRNTVPSPPANARSSSKEKILLAELDGLNRVMTRAAGR